jgi:predicted permease
MEEILSKLLPIFIYFLLGISARKSGLASAENGGFMVKLAFYYTLPALIFSSISQTHLTTDLVFLPISGFLVVCLVAAGALVVAKLTHLDRKQTGTLMLGSMAMNGAFAFPIILIFFGTQALTYAVLFDIGNAIMVFSACYAVAFHYGDEESKGSQIAKNIIQSPLLWTVFLAIILSVTQVNIPKPLSITLEKLGQITGPLLLMGMGIVFSPAKSQLKPAFGLVTMRMFGGLTAAFILFVAFGIDNREQQVAMLLCAASPLGMSALSYSLIAGLNSTTLSSAISISILIGIVWLPSLALYFL